MPYVKHSLTLLIDVDPVAAKKQIMAAIKHAAGDVEVAAQQLVVTRRTLDRWVIRLGIASSASAAWAHHKGLPAHGEQGDSRETREKVRETKRRAKAKKPSAVTSTSKRSRKKS